MVASDNLSPAQFFHGTTAVLKSGDVLQPGREVGRNNYGGHDDDTVFVTNSHDVASQYAMMAHENDEMAHAHPEQRLGPRVYEVDVHPHTPRMAGHPEEFEVPSARVTREIPLVERFRGH